MDTPMITALAAASGSIVGAVVSGFIAWNTQRMQTVRELTQERLRERQTLYGEFITEASRLVVDAVSHSLETAEKLVILYGILGRIRLVSSGKVLAEAEKCVRQIVDLYESPNLTVEQVRALVGFRRFRPAEGFQLCLPGRAFEDCPDIRKLESKQ